MNDGQRVYPVNYFFLHHSTGPDFANAEDIEVQDWYSNTGKARGYSNGAINSNHEHPSRPGVQTYAMAQFTLREYTKDGNKYGYRLTDLIKNPWANVAWAVGNWDFNTKSSSVEVCGNFLNKVLPQKALMCLADFLREIDQELGGTLNVWLHQEVFATACPARIKEQRDTVVDMINNPNKWNAILWPPAPVIVTPPAPVITTKDIESIEVLPFATSTVNDPTVTGDHVVQKGVDGKATYIYRVTFTDGVETNRVAVGGDHVAPIDEKIIHGTFVAPVPQTPTTSTDAAPGWFRHFLTAIIEAFTNFISKEK